MLVLVASVPVIDGEEEVIVRVPCIHNPVWFQEDQEQIKALLNTDNEVNAINLAFAWKLALYIWKTNVGNQKIDGSILEIFGMVIANF